MLAVDIKTVYIQINNFPITKICFIARMRTSKVRINTPPFFNSHRTSNAKAVNILIGQVQPGNEAGFITRNIRLSGNKVFGMAEA